MVMAPEKRSFLSHTTTSPIFKHSVHRSWVCTWIRYTEDYPLLISTTELGVAKQAAHPAEVSPVCQSLGKQRLSRRTGKPVGALPAS